MYVYILIMILLFNIFQLIQNVMLSTVCLIEALYILKRPNFSFLRQSFLLMLKDTWEFLSGKFYNVHFCVHSIFLNWNKIPSTDVFPYLEENPQLMSASEIWASPKTFPEEAQMGFATIQCALGFQCKCLHVTSLLLD